MAGVDQRCRRYVQRFYGRRVTRTDPARCEALLGPPTRGWHRTFGHAAGRGGPRTRRGSSGRQARPRHAIAHRSLHQRPGRPKPRSADPVKPRGTESLAGQGRGACCPCSGPGGDAPVVLKAPGRARRRTRSRSKRQAGCWRRGKADDRPLQPKRTRSERTAASWASPSGSRPCCALWASGTPADLVRNTGLPRHQSLPRQPLDVLEITEELLPHGLRAGRPSEQPIGGVVDKDKRLGALWP